MSYGIGDPSNPFDPASLGLSGAAPASASQDTTPGIARAAINATEHPLSGSNAILWAGGLIAATFGLIAFSTSGRVGPFSAKASVGRKA